MRSEAGSPLTSADPISPLGAGVPVLRRHRLTPPEHNEALANHKYISLFLPSVLISLYSKKKRGKKKSPGLYMSVSLCHCSLGGLTEAALFAGCGRLGSQRRWGSAPRIRNGRAAEDRGRETPGAALTTRGSFIAPRYWLLLVPSQCKWGPARGVLVN